MRYQDDKVGGSNLNDTVNWTYVFDAQMLEVIEEWSIDIAKRRNINTY